MKLAEVRQNMQKTIEATQRSFNTIRTGRANASLLDRIMVEYYGVDTPLRSLANINVPDASTITIQPFDKGSAAQIEKAIAMSDIGLTPNNDGELIRLNIPPLTSERRQQLVKMAGKLAEEGKVAIRNIRRDAIDSVRKEEKIAIFRRTSRETYRTKFKRLLMSSIKKLTIFWQLRNKILLPFDRVS